MPRELTPERLSRIVNAPMAMRPESLQALTSQIVSMDVFDDAPELEASILEQAPEAAEAKTPRLPKVSGAVAVVPVYGGIGQHRRGDYWASVYSEELVGMVRQMIDTPNVGAVVLSFDSPGGIVYGVQEASQAIREMSQVKPIYGHTKGMAASAGYWLATSTTKLFANSSAELGSIGVWTMHIDASKMLEDIGWNVTMISAGKYKVEGHPYGPLEDESREFIQAGVDRYYEDFLDGVATGRNVSKPTVKNDFGEGRMFGAQQALSVGMIDGIATMDELLAGLMKPASDTSRRSRASAIAIAESWSPTIDA